VSAGAPGSSARSRPLAGLDPGPLELALRVGLLILLLDPPASWLVRIPLQALAGAALLLPGLLRRPGTWLGLAALDAFGLARDWPFPDNHDYLRVLFAVAAACALAAREPTLVLARSARLLVGLAFAFALVWKLGLSPEYRDGTFFRVTLATDARFENLAVLGAGLDYPRWERGAAALSAASRGRVAFEASGFEEPPALRRLALAVTAWTAGIELVVALAFLWPGARGPARWRAPALLVFAASTYAFAPVRGFGWVLMALGIAASDPARPRQRAAYLGVFLLVEIYRSVPLAETLVRALGRAGPS
jgi:hypothetical protein